ncbi:MAG: sugar phosphate nucleotidyltransferase [Lachnospiraceae bacterium]|nr:sugar phosphate nucleotidyltransferase [Lachnospiraceae bacterium]
MKKTALVIMAAGIGSRFGGGIKQLTSFGPNGEIIMDYSIYDAVKAGFNKIVFVIRKDLEKDFREIIGNRIEKEIEVEYAFQELTDLPEGFSVPEGRRKPWGTGQAILACRKLIKEPFAVINADDYYGKEAFVLVHDYLVNQEGRKDGVFPVCMAGFILKNTLSDHGGVTRGICRVDENGELAGVDETRNIIKVPEGAAVLQEDGTRLPIDSESLVSMNMWGFTPDFVEELETGFVRFLSGLDENAEKAEYLLPTIIDQMLKKKQVEITVLKTTDKWFGVTYKEDVPTVVADFKRLLEEGVYPAKLWKS